MNAFSIARSPAPLQLGAALEILGCLAAVAAAALCFLAGWLSCDQAAVLTVLLLLALIGLAWKRFAGGRHPCFFFLCTLTLFQAGQMIAYCAGGTTDIFRITLLTPYPFDVSRAVAGGALLSLALSAIAVYAPCRCRYRFFSPRRSRSCDRFLPYLYLLLGLSVPVQLFKNYRYYEYAQDHGGYLVFFIDHGGLAASVPLPVRAVALISLPALVGILALERRKNFRRAAAAGYFLVAVPLLLTGSRGATFSLALSLCYLSRMQSGARARLFSAGLLGAGLILAASWIGSFRIGDGRASALAAVSAFVAGQGISLNVTEVAVAYRRQFAPYIVVNLGGELQSAFVAGDQTNYRAGKHFSDDVSMFLGPDGYQLGAGSGSAYIAEAYVLGGLGGVALISLLLGALLHGLQAWAHHPFGLFLTAMVLPDVLLMPRGGLLDWVSAALRVGISVLLLLGGWHLYQGVVRLGCVLRRNPGWA